MFVRKEICASMKQLTRFFESCCAFILCGPLGMSDPFWATGTCTQRVLVTVVSSTDTVVGHVSIG